jgi:hypothetical protein
MSRVQEQNKALPTAISAVEAHLDELVNLAWEAYAEPRWKHGTPTERNKRLQVAAETFAACERMRKLAER